MSVIIKAGSDICKANTNTSTAKYQYTFPKAARFPERKVDKSKYGEYTFYSLPSTLSKRFTKFGYGTKCDFTKAGKNTANKFYSTGTDFDMKNPHSPKYSFANGRDKYGKVFLETAKPFDKEIPGPGKYNILKEFGWDAPKVSFKRKYDNPETRKKKGEGEEDKNKDQKLSNVTIQIRPNGKYAVSQIPNVNSLKFDKDRSRRTKFVANKNPGPGAYDSKWLMGRIFPSQFRSYEPISIGQKHKIKDSRSNYPGPGSYILPSDFGIYQSKNAADYPKENVYVEEKKKPVDDKPWRHGMKKIKPKKKVEEDNYDYYNDNNEANDYNQEQKEKEEKEQEKIETKNEKEKEESKNDNEKEEMKKEKEKEEAKIEENKKENETGENKNEEEKKDDEKKEEEKKPEEKKEDKEEDKKSEYNLLRDILQYSQN